MMSSPYFCTLTLENTKLQPGTWRSSSSSSSLHWRTQLSWPTYTCTWCTTACLISQHCVQATNLIKSFLLPLKVNHQFEQRSSENFAKLSALAQLVFIMSTAVQNRLFVFPMRHRQVPISWDIITLHLQGVGTTQLNSDIVSRLVNHQKPVLCYLMSKCCHQEIR